MRRTLIVIVVCVCVVGAIVSAYKCVDSRQPNARVVQRVECVDTSGHALAGFFVDLKSDPGLTAEKVVEANREHERRIGRCGNKPDTSFFERMFSFLPVKSVYAQETCIATSCGGEKWVSDPVPCNAPVCTGDREVGSVLLPNGPRNRGIRLTGTRDCLHNQAYP